jgi:arylsulfatase A-like enzyme
MKRTRTRTTNALLGLALFASAAGTAVASAQADAAGATPERPNILFIIADDASCDTMGVYGSTYCRTPNIDRLAHEGVRFTNAYNCNPKCAPARACILTGRYSWQLEEGGNHNPFLSDKWAFYPALLAQNGYFVGHTGKGWGPGVYKGRVQGLDTKGSTNPAGQGFIGKTIKPPYKGISSCDYAGNFGVFLNKKPAGQPFCFWLGAREPHRSYQHNSYKRAGKKLEDVTVPGYLPDNPVVRGDLADYALEVEWFDTQVGRSLKQLQNRGLLDNTLVIVTSDHGMPFPRVKGQSYDEAFRVPLVARWANHIQPGRVVTDFITFPDVAPTLLEAAGLKPHPQMTGRSFLDLLLSPESGRVTADRDHTLLGKERHDLGRTDGDLVSVGYPTRAIRTDHYLYVRNFKPDRWPAGDPEYGYLNTDSGPSKNYILQHQDEPDGRPYYALCFGKRPMEELYDITKDRDCLHNLADDPGSAAVKAALWQQLQTELTAQRDPRMLGQGDIFDFYPNRNIDKARKLYRGKFYDPVKAFGERYPDAADPAEESTQEAP